MPKRKICVLVNPAAGNGRAQSILKLVENRLKELSVDFRIIITRDIADARSRALEASGAGEYVAVMGGDGTVSEIAGVLRNLQGTLGLIPGGRGNDFARMLGYPLEPLQACEVLARGQELVVDMGLVNHKPYLSICSLGFDSLANQIANDTNLIKGRAVYLYAGLRALLQWKPAVFIVTIDGREYRHTGYSVAVANSRCYGGGMYLSPSSSLMDGLLEVVMLGDVNKFHLIRYIPRLFNGTLKHEQGYKVIQGRHVHIRTEQAMTAYADGDAVQSAPVEISVLPQSLRVLAPGR